MLELGAISVDIADVNNPETKPWLKHGTVQSPREMINELGFDGFVEFKIQPPLDYLLAGEETFDFIFIDGNHALPDAYRMAFENASA